MSAKAHLILSLIVYFSACKVQYSADSHQNISYKISNSTLDTTSALDKLLRPYRDSMLSQMSIVLGDASADFKKEKPSGSLGNLVADAMIQEAKSMNIKADACIYNHGGVRINELKQGQITVGKVFELLPFENELVLLEVPGDVLIKWFELILKSGGWPVSDELKLSAEGDSKSFSIRKIEDAEAQFQPIAPSKTYRILTNDYVANGGDNCEFLKGLNKNLSGVLIRDLMIKYIKAKGIVKPDNQLRIKISN